MNSISDRFSQKDPKSHCQFMSEDSVPNEVKRIIRSLARHKFTGNPEAEDALTKIGIAYFQQITTLAMEKAKRNDNFVSSASIVSAVHDTGLPTLAKKLEKHEQHCRQKDKDRILRELRNDPEVKVTSEECFNFVESLFEQGIEFHGRTSLEKTKTVPAEPKRKPPKIQLSVPKRVKKSKDDSSEWCDE